RAAAPLKRPPPSPAQAQNSAKPAPQQRPSPCAGSTCPAKLPETPRRAPPQTLPPSSRLPVQSPEPRLSAAARPAPRVMAWPPPLPKAAHVRLPPSSRMRFLAFPAPIQTHRISPRPAAVSYLAKADTPAALPPAQIPPRRGPPFPPGPATPSGRRSIHTIAPSAPGAPGPGGARLPPPSARVAPQIVAQRIAVASRAYLATNRQSSELVTWNRSRVPQVPVLYLGLGFVPGFPFLVAGLQTGPWVSTSDTNCSTRSYILECGGSPPLLRTKQLRESVSPRKTLPLF